MSSQTLADIATAWAKSGHAPIPIPPKSKAPKLKGWQDLRLTPENEISESLPENARSIVALRAVDEHFGGILPVFVTVDWPPHVPLASNEFRQVLQDVHGLCERHEAVGHPFSVLNVVIRPPNSESNRNRVG